MKIRSYDDLVKRIAAAATARNLEFRTLGEVQHQGVSYPILMLKMGSGSIPVCVSAGIHGDEPAGVEAAARFLEGAGPPQDLIDKFSITIYPCDNPSGYEYGTRENAQGVDLNREFRKSDASPEVKILMESLARCDFQLFFEMHEDIDAYGLYLYELYEDPRWKVGNLIIEQARQMGLPINMDDEIEGMPAHGGIISSRKAQLPTKNLPKAVYLYQSCAKHVITMEPPVSAAPLDLRVDILLRSLETALRTHVE